MATWTSENQNYSVGIWVASTEWQVCYPMWGAEKFCRTGTFLETGSQLAFVLLFGTSSPTPIFIYQANFLSCGWKFELPPLRNSPWCPQFHISVSCSLPPWHSTYPYNSPHQFKGKCQPTNVSLPLHNELPEAKDYILFSAVDLMPEI